MVEVEFTLIGLHTYIYIYVLSYVEDCGILQGRKEIFFKITYSTRNYKKRKALKTVGSVFVCKKKTLF